MAVPGSSTCPPVALSVTPDMCTLTAFHQSPVATRDGCGAVSIRLPFGPAVGTCACNWVYGVRVSYCSGSTNDCGVCGLRLDFPCWHGMVELGQAKLALLLHAFTADTASQVSPPPTGDPNGRPYWPVWVSVCGHPCVIAPNGLTQLKKVSGF